jgi:hypothetical protein
MNRNMKKSTKIIFAIAAVIWTIGAVILYKKEGPNVAIISSGVILVIGFVSQIRKKVTKE